MMEWLRKVIQDPRTERFIMALIVLNAVTLGLETSQSVMAKFGSALVVIDRIIIAIFVMEILARLTVHAGPSFATGGTSST
jgi:voltage-gated sodium channel